MTPSLRVQLLGDFCLIYDGLPVKAVHSARLRTLLAYLILHCGAPQLRQHLAFLLWPDSSEEQARTNLRNLLHRLKEALPHSNCCLHCEGQTVVWLPHLAYVLDVVEFEDAIQRGELARAVELYRGELLPECYGDWITPERDRLHQMCLVALERLAQAAEDACAIDAALAYARRLSRNEPLCDAHTRRLMRLQMLAGDRACAVRTYRVFAAALQHELGLDPDPVTQQFYAQLLYGAGATPPC